MARFEKSLPGFGSAIRRVTKKVGSHPSHSTRYSRAIIKSTVGAYASATLRVPMLMPKAPVALKSPISTTSWCTSATDNGKRKVAYYEAVSRGSQRRKPTVSVGGVSLEALKKFAK